MQHLINWHIEESLINPSSEGAAEGSYGYTNTLNAANPEDNKRIEGPGSR